eukprot:CAMPEP_0117546312 /NCGR_PEP_ID=MMETSP0784-20121206/46542_1 /TAXON_ID=39447 /ORGANISM="" /LENGTH=235 /DNA_ID=CAMNT_0005343179 /DNA_START=40 /DNA_END=747 /DNA_ORIENTATION=-
MVRLFGLTGPIACGKSAVAKCFEREGIPVVDADVIAHQLYADKSSKMSRRVIAQFGPGVLGADGAVDRQKLGELVFGDPGKLAALNRATHGPIMQALLWKTFSLLFKGHRQIALDIPLLAKFPRFRKLCLAATVVVVVPGDTQLQRLMARNGFSREEALTRMAKQMNAEEQIQMADYVLDNSGSLEDLGGKVSALLGQLPRGWTIYEDLLALGVLLAAGAAGLTAAGNATILSSL